MMATHAGSTGDPSITPENEITRDAADTTRSNTGLFTSSFRRSETTDILLDDMPRIVRIYKIHRVSHHLGIVHTRVARDQDP